MAKKKGSNPLSMALDWLNENREGLEDLLNMATDGPWDVWEGPEYKGGGADFCIGSGPSWLANMDRRFPAGWTDFESVQGMSAEEQEEFLEEVRKANKEHELAGDCDVVSLEARIDEEGELISIEQAANADLIALSRTAVPHLLAIIDGLQEELAREDMETINGDDSPIIDPEDLVEDPETVEA
jgi:hypothetical protein